MNLPRRKRTRLKGYDYNSPGYYFITMCTEDRKAILCDIVGTGVLDGPLTRLSAYGTIADQQLRTMAAFYDDVELAHYVIMPNHIHLLLHLREPGSGPSGRPVPTNSKISSFIGTFKRFCNRAYGQNIWQYRSYDHIVRNEAQYLKIWEYISNNPATWADDDFFVD